MDTEIRRLRAGDADLPDIVAQINDADMEVGEPFTVASLGAFLSDDRNVYLTAHIERRLAGTLHAMAYLHPAGSRNLYVDEVDTAVAFRRRGVATAMLRAAFELARADGVRAVWLGDDEGNDAADALYRSLAPDEIEPGTIFTWEV